jgi:hypothetical protein
MKHLKFFMIVMTLFIFSGNVFALNISTPITNSNGMYGRNSYTQMPRTNASTVNNMRRYNSLSNRNSLNRINSISQNAHNMIPSTHPMPVAPYNIYYPPVQRRTNVVYKNNPARNTSMTYYYGNGYYPSGGYYYYTTPPITTQTTTINTGNGSHTYTEQYFGNYVRNGINTVRSGNTTSMSRFLSW